MKIVNREQRIGNRNLIALLRGLLPSGKMHRCEGIINREQRIGNRNLIALLRGYISTFAGLMLMLMMALTSCDVHQFPEMTVNPEPPDNPDVPENPENPANSVKVPLNLVYDTDFYVWDYDYDPKLGKVQEKYPDTEIFPGYPGTTSKYDNLQSQGVLDVNVKVYKSSNTGKTVFEETFTRVLDGRPYDDSIELQLEEKSSFIVAVWSHLRDAHETNPFYDITNFHKVGLINENYRGNTDYRDGFSGTLRIETSEKDEEKPQEIRMTRPMGKFELVTLDLSEFLDRETTRRNLGTRARADEYNVMISFPLYYPNSYSVMDDRLENSASNVSFMTHMTVNGETEASLGFEYVLLNNIKDGGVQMRVDIYDPDYVHVAGSTTLTIPMRRDHHTLLRGNFLSEENEGGIGIDPGFNGDFNIPM